MPRAFVLGAREGSGNIGEAIVNQLRNMDWEVDADSCERNSHWRGNPSWGYYSPPGYDIFKREDYDALVVTLGKTLMKPFWEATEQDIYGVLTACLTLPLEAVRRFVRAAEENGQEKLRRIVLTGSYAYRHPFTNGTAYCSAKAGLDMAVRTLGWELTDRGYRVYVVHPFHVQGTPMWKEVHRGVMETKDMDWIEADAYNRKDLKMPDLCEPVDVAEVVGFLLSGIEGAQWLSGTAVEMFGGTR